MTHQKNAVIDTGRNADHLKINLLVNDPDYES